MEALYDGIHCLERCTLAGHAFAVAPSGRLYACAQLIAEDTSDELVIGTVERGLDRQRLAELQRQKEAFINAADQAASVLHAEACPSFMDTYYRKRYRAADGASLTRLRRPSGR